MTSLIEHLRYRHLGAIQSDSETCEYYMVKTKVFRMFTKMKEAAVEEIRQINGKYS